MTMGLVNRAAKGLADFLDWAFAPQPCETVRGLRERNSYLQETVWSLQDRLNRMTRENLELRGQVDELCKRLVDRATAADMLSRAREIMTRLSTQ
jgi:predicted transcriptional regulator